VTKDKITLISGLHFLNSRYTGNGEIVSLMGRLPFTLREIPRGYFCSKLSRPQGRGVTESIRSVGKSSDFKNKCNWDLPTSSVLGENVRM
jgi:hypothetical protein